MRRLPRPCLDCGQLTTNQSRCDLHQAKEEERKFNTPQAAERREKKRLLYGAEYQKRARVLRATATHCHICKQPFTPYDKVEADHLLPGDPDSPLAPAHRLCNQQRSNKPLE